MSVAAFQAFVHSNVPHEGVALYLAEGGSALLALGLVAAFGLITRSFQKLEPAWTVRVSAGAAPIPVYVILMLSPVDPDLRQALDHEQIVVALAGFIALGVTLRDFGKLCAGARKEGKSARSKAGSAKASPVTE